ncbi:MAG: galactose mutarotase [Flavobacteriaceae bacterium]|nr:galactose mutarotase [Flavobacteriaceae bacterium]
MSLFLLTIQCNTVKKNQTKPEEMKAITISKSDYGKTPDGISVEQYILKNKKGMKIAIITYGGIITSWTAPDKNGMYQDIVLGYNSLDEYIKSTPYFGAIIGRYGNRIANGKFTLEGIEYTLAQNNGPNNLHGGIKGFDKVVWNAEEVISDTIIGLKLTYHSKDKEEGFPGNLETVVTYTLTEDNTLEVLYEATTDKKTIINLTQHSYFNLSGDFNKTILNHEITIDADTYIPVDETLIPTGELAPVAGTPFDFRKPKTMALEINADNDQLKKGGGYDHCWVLNDQDEGMRLNATAYHPESGRVLEVFSNEPGIQLYSGNFLDGTLPSKNGGTYAYRSGFCLETQHYPDSPNQNNFPSVVLSPGEKYSSKTSFKFSVK